VLEDVARSVPPHDQLIVAGDLNAISVVDRLGFDKVVGPYGSGALNDNTIRLLTFCSILGFTLIGSWYRHPDISDVGIFSQISVVGIFSTSCFFSHRLEVEESKLVYVRYYIPSHLSLTMDISSVRHPLTPVMTSADKASAGGLPLSPLVVVDGRRVYKSMGMGRNL